MENGQSKSDFRTLLKTPDNSVVFLSFVFLNYHSCCAFTNRNARFLFGCTVKSFLIFIYLYFLSLWFWEFKNTDMEQNDISKIIYTCMTFKILFNFIFVIVDLQCCANFCCTAKWLSHRPVCILFLILSSIVFSLKWLDIVPCALQ